MNSIPMRASHALLAAVCLMAVGCNYQAPGPPEYFPTTKMEGRITFTGKPIEKGWVTLFPMDGALGHPVIVPIRVDGRYETDEAPIGMLAVRVTLPKSHTEGLHPSLASKLEALGGIRSPLRVKTAGDIVNHFDVDLAVVPVTSP